MITVNGKDAEYEEGATVASLLKKMGFVFPLIIVKINGELISRDAYDRTPVSEGDDVQVIHMMSGG